MKYLIPIAITKEERDVNLVKRIMGKEDEFKSIAEFAECADAINTLSARLGLEPIPIDDDTCPSCDGAGCLRCDYEGSL